MGIKSTAKKYYKKFKKAFTRNNNNETVTISGISRRGAVRRQTNVNIIPEISGNGAVENGIGSNQNYSNGIQHEDTINLLYYGIDRNNTLSGQNSSVSNSDIEDTIEQSPSEQGVFDSRMNETNVNIIPEISGNGAVVDENGIDSNQNDAHDLVHDIDLLSYGIVGNNTLSGQELGPISEQERISNLERTAQRFRDELRTFIPELETFIPEEDIIFVEKEHDIDIDIETVDEESMVGEISNVVESDESDESIISKSMDSYGEQNGSIDSHNSRNNSLINGQYNSSAGPSNSETIKEVTKKVSTDSLKSNWSQNSIN